jgi:3-hydroxyacyl-CoA dehydrogenase
MNYSDRLQNVAVLGAAGKMGSGILLLTAVEMADLSLLAENREKTYVLNAIDLSDKGLAGLRDYLRVQVQKLAEKKTIQLRKVYAHRADLIENGEIIEQYVYDVLSIVRTTTRIEAAYDALIVFEAASENPELKVSLFSQIDQNNRNKPWFFTNTSSIPISFLETKANLIGRVIGFHFYNPPAIQKLVELITTSSTMDELNTFAVEYAQHLKKVVVRSHDKAGFIGNGHFMRDILHAVSETEKLLTNLSFSEAVYIVNKVSQEYLVRPMGVYQLIDYVGIDVCAFIMKVMDPYYTDETIHSPLLHKLLDSNIKGGQYSDGTQKDGVLKYQKGSIVGIYDFLTNDYVPINQIAVSTGEYFNPSATNCPAWKNVVKLKDTEALLAPYFNSLTQNPSKAAKLAIAYGQKSKEIGERLVSSNVAYSFQDVNTVLMTGFFHAYGPVNNYFNQ